jgi:dipeptidyl aminopeptidase/acylaminoacyl peptidase
LPAGRIVGLAAGEAAILVPTSARSGTLLRVPLQGGGARTVAEGVATADWARDGSAFAIVRVEDGFDRLEYPPGRTLYRTPGTLLDIRISPDGRMVGLLENPVRGHLQARVGVVGDTGDVRFLTAGEDMMRVIVWSPDGREIWASDYHERARSEPGLSLLAASLSGRQRLLLRLPIDFRVLDVGPQGQALLAVDHIRWEAAGRLAGDDRERDLRFRDRTFVMDVSPDGRTILFTDRDPRVGRLAAVLQRAGEPQPVRLDVGEPQSLSPDGSRLTLFDYDTDTLRVIPVGAGEAFTPSRGTIAHYFNSRWLPDGRRILIAAQEKDRPKRLFVQEVPAGLPRPVTPEGVINMYPAISPDGKWVAAGLEQDGALQAAWPLDGGESRPLRGLLPGDWVVRWSQDGRFVYSYEVGRVQPPWPIHRVDLVTGRREVWKEVSPPGPSGALILSRIHLTPDGRSYGYTFRHLQSELYLVSGLR